MFTLTRSGPIVTVTCARCPATHTGNDRTAATFKRAHLDDCQAATS